MLAPNDGLRCIHIFAVRNSNDKIIQDEPGPIFQEKRFQLSVLGIDEKWKLDFMLHETDSEPQGIVKSVTNRYNVTNCPLINQLGDRSSI